MINFKNVRTGKVFKFDSEEKLIQFIDGCDEPENMSVFDIFYCDGAGFNGKVSKICYGLKNKLKIERFSDDLTNNVAEYMAMIKAMELCGMYDHVMSDSMLVVNQILGVWDCKVEHLIPFMEKARGLLNSKRLSIGWVGRNDNLAGIKLDKDKKNCLS